MAERHPEKLRALNAWLCDYAAMIDANGLLRADFTLDGIHPTRAAYAVMAPIVQAAIDRALSRPRP